MIDWPMLRKAAQELKEELRHPPKKRIKRKLPTRRLHTAGPEVIVARLYAGTLACAPTGEVFSDAYGKGRWRQLKTHPMTSRRYVSYTYVRISLKNGRYHAPLHKVCVIARRALLYGIDVCLLPEGWQVHHIDNDPSNCNWGNLVAVPARVNEEHSPLLDRTLYDEVGYPIDWDDPRYDELAGPVPF